VSPAAFRTVDRPGFAFLVLKPDDFNHDSVNAPPPVTALRHDQAAASGMASRHSSYARLCVYLNVSPQPATWVLDLIIILSDASDWRGSLSAVNWMRRCLGKRRELMSLRKLAKLLGRNYRC
jgi:hypothetical protein